MAKTTVSDEARARGFCRARPHPIHRHRQGAAALPTARPGTIETHRGRHDRRAARRPRRKLVEFDAKEFQDFRHGYAGTIYKGQGRTLDQTYLYHSEHWRSAASYVALTRHRDKAALFVARNTAEDVKQLARQMARVDDRRAASHFLSARHAGARPAADGKSVAADRNCGRAAEIIADDPPAELDE